MLEDRRLVHITRIPIRWGDMDAVGHVNNTIYFRYMEQARVEWLEELRLKAGPKAPFAVVVNASCTFLIPFAHPGTVEVRFFADKPGRSSLQTYYELRLVDDERIYAEGSAKMVFTDSESGKSMVIPDNLRRLIDPQ
ncbi:MAG: acyl-CoA thioesterase [Rhodocyclaceae bacterium]|nr:acyl-CoA thioesterase [Rhodocyclaceae bacterium]MBX3669334.1 acyl-CoA thioesterase [Rhodocyclaceae bacterium]